MSILVSVVALALAAEPLPDALSPQQVADGWLLLYDGESTFGWTIDGPSQVENGVLVLGGDQAVTATSFARFGPIAYSIRHAPLPEADKGPTLSVAGQASPLQGRDRDVTEVKATTNRAPIQITVPAGQRLRLRQLWVRPLALDSLFDGKTLDGWKVFPGEKYRSKFTVTPEGWLNVKDGPGDLQTTKRFADFVLQLECISHGPWLNSGIFFRCLPEQYQQGYEAQIRNQWLGNDRTKPVDFGTGAIYRRQPARKVVSTDQEWFTLTLLADGPHLATWVNGYPVAAWTDTRPPAENARQGLKTGPGHISIQGHDPTTNLSFRRLRAAELPPLMPK